MTVGERIKKLRDKKDLSTTDLGRLAGISQSTISKLENGKRKADLDTLLKIAESLKVSVDYLTGESASSIIEARLEEIGMALPTLAEKANVPVTFLENLDSIVPDLEIDLGEQCYRYMTSIAWILGLPGSQLRTAFARQEIPVSEYPDNPPGNLENLEKDFGEMAFEESTPKRTTLIDADFQAITEAARKMTPEQRKKTLKLLRLTFDEFFSEEE